MQGSHGSAGWTVTEAPSRRARPRRLAVAVYRLLVLAVLLLCDAGLDAALAAPPEDGERCVRHDQGRVECRASGTNAFVYSWPVTPDMAGQTLDVSSLTLGVSLFPPIQAIAAGQSKASFELRGATPGQTVKLAKKLVKAEQEKGDSSESCCIEEFEIKIPQAKLCTEQVASRTPRPTNQSRPTSPPAKIAIEKSCAACPAGGACRCKITVRNVGTEPLTAPVKFRDETRVTGGEGDGDTARIDTIAPDGDDWTCSGPPKSLRCELSAASLKPVSSRSVIVTLEPRELKTGQGARMRNCVSLQGDNPGYTIVGNREACVELGGDIAVRKTGDANCRFGEQCTFEVTIANRSPSAYVGPLMLADDMTLGKGSGRKAEIVSIEPPLGCANEPRSLPFACSANVILQGGKTRTHRIVVRMPQDPDGGKDGKGELTGRNCFAAGAPSGDREKPDENVASLLKTSQKNLKSPTSQDARACVEFSAVPRCPGDLVLQGSQCGCPGGTERVDDDRCRPACGPGDRLRGGECVAKERPTATPLPVVPLRERPPREVVFSCPGELQAYGRPGNQYCDCPPDEVRSGDQCSPRRVAPCPGDLKRYGTLPNEYCACPPGLIRSGTTCRSAPTPVPCPGDLKLYGPPGNQVCGCPSGQVQNGTRCAAPPTQPISCPGDLKLYGPPGNQVCGCPPGQIRYRTSCSAPTPTPITCPGSLQPSGPLGSQVCGCKPPFVQQGIHCLTGGVSNADNTPGASGKCADGSKPPCPTKPCTKADPSGCDLGVGGKQKSEPGICPDGTKVPAGAKCPVYKTCSNGSKVLEGTVCPPSTKSCPDGSKISPNETCPKVKSGSPPTKPASPPPPPPKKEAPPAKKEPPPAKKEPPPAKRAPPPPPPPVKKAPPPAKPVYRPPPPVIRTVPRCPPGTSGVPPNCRTIVR
jgi:hypothetical protein